MISSGIYGTAGIVAFFFGLFLGIRISRGRKTVTRILLVLLFSFGLLIAVGIGLAVLEFVLLLAAS